MSEVPQGGGGGGKHKGGKPKGKKSSTHIDMTPMVDLAFLLLTFFMLTTSFNKPKTMEIIMPDKPKKDAPIPEINEHDVMNVLLGPNNKLYYYVGLKTPQMEATSYDVNGIQKVLLDPKYTSNPKFMVLIKPAPDSKYKNVVNIFDIMRIAKVARYAMVDITEDEKKMLKTL